MMSSSVTTGSTDSTPGAPSRPEPPPVPNVDGDATDEVAMLRRAVVAERARGDWRFAELKRQAQAAVAERDAAIDKLRQHIRAKQAEFARTNATTGAGWLAGLAPDEARAREQYELGRFGPAKLWALLMLRTLPAMPLMALVASLILYAARIASVR